ncbi:MAG: GspE/PulE family protein, partial [Christensenellaceae bacterium]
TLPTVYGEKVVVRLLASSLSKGIINKEDIGFTAHNMAMFDDLIKTSHGIILVTGPTGSGKTTTLYAIVKEILNAQINIVTVEDPVEYKIEGASQMQINTKAGLTFATGLRSILRQDPDVIMIGEIRDNETAEISIRAAITGHLVLSTLHTNDAITTINRLVDMDVKPYLVSASLAGIIAQRLVRLICPKCNKEYTSNETENTALGISDSVTLHKGTGCPFCNYTGYKGRKAVHEIVIVDDAMRSMITKEVPSSVMYEYVKDKGTTTLKQNVIELVLAGETTVEELIEVTYSL